MLSIITSLAIGLNILTNVYATPASERIGRSADAVDPNSFTVFVHGLNESEILDGRLYRLIRNVKASTRHLSIDGNGLELSAIFRIDPTKPLPAAVAGLNISTAENGRLVNPLSNWNSFASVPPRGSCYAPNCHRQEPRPVFGSDYEQQRMTSEFCGYTTEIAVGSAIAAAGIGMVFSRAICVVAGPGGQPAKTLCDVFFALGVAAGGGYVGLAATRDCEEHMRQIHSTCAAAGGSVICTEPTGNTVGLSKLATTGVRNCPLAPADQCKKVYCDSRYCYN